MTSRTEEVMATTAAAGEGGGLAAAGDGEASAEGGERGPVVAGAIVGSVVGGAVLLALLVLVGVPAFRRRRAERRRRQRTAETEARRRRRRVVRQRLHRHRSDQSFAALIKFISFIIRIKSDRYHDKTQPSRRFNLLEDEDEARRREQQREGEQRRDGRREQVRCRRRASAVVEHRSLKSQTG